MWDVVFVFKSMTSSYYSVMDAILQDGRSQCCDNVFREWLRVCNGYFHIYIGRNRRNRGCHANFLQYTSLFQPVELLINGLGQKELGEVYCD